MNILECLNQDAEHPVTSAIRLSSADVGEEASLQSDPDVDHQLLIKLGFQQPIKLRAITFSGNTEDETAPRVVKLFQGHMDMGFQEAEDQAAVETLNLSSSHL